MVPELHLVLVQVVEVVQVVQVLPEFHLEQELVLVQVVQAVLMLVRKLVDAQAARFQVPAIMVIAVVKGMGAVAVRVVLQLL